MRIDLTKGITETEQYKAWKFPGGEIHVQLKQSIDCDYQGANVFDIYARLNTSEDIMFLLIFTDTLKKDYRDSKINLFLPYMPYQQADRNFGKNECFSLKTMCNIINSMNYNTVTLFDPHSDVSPALLNNCEVQDNSEFIRTVINNIYWSEYYRIMSSASINDTKKEVGYSIDSFYNDIIIVSPDASAYKKIFKLCEKIGFTGQIETCSKSRNHKTGELTLKIPEFDSNKLVLIVDDIALGSRTFFNIRKGLKNEKVYLAVSHGVFNENIDLLQTNFIKVYTTNTIRDERIGENIEIIKIF